MRIVDKFNRDNFFLFKFKMEMILDEKELWEFVHGSEKALQAMWIQRSLQCSRRGRRGHFPFYAHTW
jgi:hypothetical protein